MSFSKSIEAKIRQAFSPEILEVINESHLHAGHQESFDGSGETHLRLRIVADAFKDMNRVERHRAVNALIAEEMEQGLHAIAITALAPDEPGAQRQPVQ